MTAVHRDWLEKILDPRYEGQTRNNIIKHSAANIANLIRYWSKLSREKSEKYDQLVRNVWQNIGATISNQIEKLPTDTELLNTRIEGHVSLLRSLKNSSNRKINKIQFDGDAIVVEDKIETTEDRVDASIEEHYEHNLNNVVERVCSQYVERARIKESSASILTPLLSLLREYDSKRLFVAIARHFKCVGERGAIYNLYDEILKQSLRDDATCTKPVVDVVFVMFPHFTETEQDAMFDSFERVSDRYISLSTTSTKRSITKLKVPGFFFLAV